MPSLSAADVTRPQLSKSRSLAKWQGLGPDQSDRRWHQIPARSNISILENLIHIPQKKQHHATPLHIPKTSSTASSHPWSSGSPRTEQGNAGGLSGRSRARHLTVYGNPKSAGGFIPYLKKSSPPSSRQSAPPCVSAIRWRILIGTSPMTRARPRVLVHH
jgi:hypothetical protein